MTTYKFYQCCVSPINSEELEYIEENMKEISGSTFLKSVSLETLNNALMYVQYTSRKELLEDWAVRFFSCRKYGAVICVNSAITYIFKPL